MASICKFHPADDVVFVFVFVLSVCPSRNRKSTCKNTAHPHVFVFVVCRSRNLSNIGVRCPEVFNGKVFPPQTDTGTYCARITVDEESAEALAERSFWPSPLYVRPWKFNRKQQRGRPDNVQSTSGIDQQPPASAPDTQPSGQ